MPKQPDFSNKKLFLEMLKIRRKEMSARMRARTRKFRPRSTWLYPFALERRYARQLKKEIKKFTDIIVNEIRLKLPGWIQEFNQDSRTDSFPSEFADSTAEWRALLQKLVDENPDIRLLITNMGFDISDQNNKQWHKFNKQLLGIEFVTTEPWEFAVVEAWGQANFELFKTLYGDYIKQVNIIVSEGVQTGRTWNVIMDDIAKVTKNITRARPELIARDQIGKLHGRMAKRRQEDVGIDKYKWLTVGDERVRGKPGGKYPHARPSHWAMDGKICRWDNSFVYSDDNGKTWKPRTSIMTTAIPGTEFQCRCSGLPWFDDIIEEADKIIKEEAGRVR